MGFSRLPGTKLDLGKLIKNKSVEEYPFSSFHFSARKNRNQLVPSGVRGTCMSECLCVPMHACRGQSRLPPPVLSLLLMPWAGVGCVLTFRTRLAYQWVPRTFCVPPQHWGYMHAQSHHAFLHGCQRFKLKSLYLSLNSTISILKSLSVFSVATEL